MRAEGKPCPFFFVPLTVQCGHRGNTRTWWKLRFSTALIKSKLWSYRRSPSEYPRRHFPYLILHPQPPAPPRLFSHLRVYPLSFSLLLAFFFFFCLILSGSPSFSNRWSLRALLPPPFQQRQSEQEAKERIGRAERASGFNNLQPHGRRRRPKRLGSSCGDGEACFPPPSSGYSSAGSSGRTSGWADEITLSLIGGFLMAAAERHIKTQQTLNSQDNSTKVTKFYQFLPTQGF